MFSRVFKANAKEPFAFTSGRDSLGTSCSFKSRCVWLVEQAGTDVQGAGWPMCGQTVKFTVSAKANQAHEVNCQAQAQQSMCRAAHTLTSAFWQVHHPGRRPHLQPWNK